MDTVKYLVVHCSATPPDMDVDATMIDRWHRQQGWFGIGYHFVIKRNGELQTGRPITQAGAHAIRVNDCSLGICLAGGVSKEDPRTAENNFTPAQMRALQRLLEQLLVKFPAAQVIGHRDVEPKKACPSFDAAKWWEGLYK
jgi:N-acetylmuramoyl-L-alanine amidase